MSIIPANVPYLKYPDNTHFTQSVKDPPTPLAIKKMHAKGVPIIQMAKHFGVSRHYISSSLFPSFKARSKKHSKDYASQHKYYDTELRRLYMQRYRIKKKLAGFYQYKSIKTNAQLLEEYNQLSILITEYHARQKITN